MKKFITYLTFFILIIVQSSCVTSNFMSKKPKCIACSKNFDKVKQIKVYTNKNDINNISYHLIGNKLIYEFLDNSYSKKFNSKQRHFSEFLKEQNISFVHSFDKEIYLTDYVFDDNINKFQSTKSLNLSGNVFHLNEPLEKLMQKFNNHDVSYLDVDLNIQFYSTEPKRLEYFLNYSAMPLWISIDLLSGALMLTAFMTLTPVAAVLDLISMDKHNFDTDSQKFYTNALSKGIYMPYDVLNKLTEEKNSLDFCN